TGRFGKFFVPFGRTNALHPHSWSYARRPLVLEHLVDPEALAGNGVSLSWLAPTGPRVFFQVDAGAFTKAGHTHNHSHEEALPQAEADEEEDHHHEHDEIPAGSGAAFADKFYTVRAWSGLRMGANGEFELGGSWARGPAAGITLSEAPLAVASRSLQLTGLDVTYRRYGRVASRLLLRGEHVWHRQKSVLGTERARGYYALASYRWDRYNDLGVLYDWSEIAGLPGHHESAGSLIYTRQFTEQTYGRLQLTRGSRPGKADYTEAWLQLVWGIGPHTHQLE
ncbi:MAG: hypothetical protein QHJ73_05350, partial [Armatimonadota bacterium]|nr:hypothetical protein [Armatimonadota bacterium]